MLRSVLIHVFSLIEASQHPQERCSSRFAHFSHKLFSAAASWLDRASSPKYLRGRSDPPGCWGYLMRRKLSLYLNRRRGPDPQYLTCMGPSMFISFIFCSVSNQTKSLQQKSLHEQDAPCSFEHLRQPRPNYRSNKENNVHKLTDSLNTYIKET